MSAPTSDGTIVLPVKRLHRSVAARLEPVITHLRFELAVIRSEADGVVHPSYPATLLHYNLLTEAQLDAMARHYHQSYPNPFLTAYPGSMNWDSEFLRYMGETYGDGVRHAIKVRKFGSFIGLSGCETPIEEIDEKMSWEERKYRATVKSPTEFAFRRGFKRW